jgi:hypothetical protein
MSRIFRGPINSIKNSKAFFDSLNSIGSPLTYFSSFVNGSNVFIDNPNYSEDSCDQPPCVGCSCEGRACDEQNPCSEECVCVDGQCVKIGACCLPDGTCTDQYSTQEECESCQIDCSQIYYSVDPPPECVEDPDSCFYNGAYWSRYTTGLSSCDECSGADVNSCNKLPPAPDKPCGTWYSGKKCSDEPCEDPCSTTQEPPCSGLPTSSECCDSYSPRGSKVGTWIGPYETEEEANNAYDAYECSGKARVAAAYECGGQFYVDVCCDGNILP